MKAVSLDELRVGDWILLVPASRPPSFINLYQICGSGAKVRYWNHRSVTGSINEDHIFRLLTGNEYDVLLASIPVMGEK